METLKHRTRQGFTLIEILMVLAIMMLMMGMAMFAFVDWGRGAKMRAAALNFRAAFNQARQHAITYRVRTHLIYGNTPPPGRGFYYLSNAADGVMGTTNYTADGVVFTNLDGVTSLNLEFKLDGSCDSDCDDIPATLDWVGNQRKIVIFEGSRVGGTYIASTMQVFQLTGTIQKNE